MPIFTRTIGIDYSGAETPTASLKGLRVYMANDDRLSVEVPPPSSPRKSVSRAKTGQATSTMPSIDWLSGDSAAEALYTPSIPNGL